MYGAFYYGIDDTVIYKKEREMAKLADRLDMNDFLHLDSPYGSHYVKPTPLATTDPWAPSSCEGEGVSDDASAGSGCSRETSPDDGTPCIDQFGTNRSPWSSAQESFENDDDVQDGDDIALIVEGRQEILPKDSGQESVQAEGVQLVVEAQRIELEPVGDEQDLAHCIVDSPSQGVSCRGDQPSRSESRHTESFTSKIGMALETPVLILSDSDDDTQVTEMSIVRPEVGVSAGLASPRLTIPSVKQEYDWWDKELERQRRKEKEDRAKERKLKEVLDYSESQRCKNEALRLKLEVLQSQMSSHPTHSQVDQGSHEVGGAEVVSVCPSQDPEFHITNISASDYPQPEDKLLKSDPSLDATLEAANATNCVPPQSKQRGHGQPQLKLCSSTERRSTISRRINPIEKDSLQQIMNMPPEAVTQGEDEGEDDLVYSNPLVDEQLVDYEGDDGEDVAVASKIAIDNTSRSESLEVYNSNSLNPDNFMCVSELPYPGCTRSLVCMNLPFLIGGPYPYLFWLTRGVYESLIVWHGR